MTMCNASCRGEMESRFGGSRLACAEVRVQEPRRGSATPGWKAASSVRSRKVRIDPPKRMGKSLADSDSCACESCASVYSRYEARTYGPVPDGAPFWPLRFFSTPESFSDDDLL